MKVEAQHGGDVCDTTEDRNGTMVQKGNTTIDDCNTYECPRMYLPL